MKKFLATILCGVLLLGALFTGLVGCDNGESWKPGNLNYAGAGKVISQNGFVAETENYLYYINGVGANTSDNTFGKAVKGALMAVKRDTLGTDNVVTEVVVPKIFSATDPDAGLFIHNGYVYYGTPNTEKDSSGSVANSEMTFVRTKLDGSGSTETFITLNEHSVKYRMVEKAGVVYIVYYDSAEQALVCYNTSSKQATTIAKTSEEVDAYSLDKYVFIDNDSIADGVVAFTVTCYTDAYDKDKADKGNYTRPTADYNKLFIYNIGDGKVSDVYGKLILDGNTEDIFARAKFNLNLFESGYLFYARTPVQGEEKVYAATVSELRGVQHAERFIGTEIVNASYVAQTSIIKSLDEVYVLENGTVFKASLKTADGFEKKPVAKTSTISALLFIENNELYYYNTSAQLAKIKLSQLADESVYEIRISNDSVSSTWFKPEIVKENGKTFVFYLDNSALGNSYVHYADVNGTVIEPEENATIPVYYIDTEFVNLIGKKTIEDQSKELNVRIENLSAVIPGIIEFEDHDAEVLTFEAVDEVKDLYDNADEKVKEGVTEENVKILNVYVKAIEIANKFNKLKGIEQYNTTDYKAEDLPEKYKLAYDEIKDEIEEFRKGEDAKQIENYIEANYKFYYQRAKEFFN